MTYSEQWRVRTVLGGKGHDFVFTDMDTVWPEAAARLLAERLAPVVDYVYLNHRRVEIPGDWEIIPRTTPSPEGTTHD